ncbi:MAG: glycosyltransferase family 4 protein [Myxacorys californica WJT36-NPBG1]|jgi:glycosyltransferase involved in cell wall biosynthesis|nr:glycosyltransferase family 4 protein [Myxacorys californica WJT36-NPBG1]
MDKHPLHVVVYTDSAGIGGAEISLGHLVATASEDIQFTITGVSSVVVDAIASRRSSARRVVLSDNPFSHLATFYSLQPDIIHINLCTPWACHAALAAALGLPYTRVIRVDQLPLRTTDAIALWKTRFLSLRVDAHVAVGEASCRRMEDFYALGRNSVISIPNGVPDCGEVKEHSTDQSITNKSIIVGSVGRLDAMKAHEILLKAIAQVEQTKVVILGEGDERHYLEALADKLSIRDRVHLPGWVEHPQSYLSTFDVVALPSRSEGFPLAMVEAMLAARPVVATRVGSIPEAILDGKTGLLIEKNDVDGLAIALQRLRDNPALRIQLGQAARDMALANFTVEAMTQRYERLWQDVMTRSRSSRLWVPRPRD